MRNVHNYVDDIIIADLLLHVEDVHSALIRQMKNWELSTCVRFIPRTMNWNHFVYFKPGERYVCTYTCKTSIEHATLTETNSVLCCT